MLTIRAHRTRRREKAATTNHYYIFWIPTLHHVEFFPLQNQTNTRPYRSSLSTGRTAFIFFFFFFPAGADLAGHWRLLDGRASVVVVVVVVSSFRPVAVATITLVFACYLSFPFTAGGGLPTSHGGVASGITTATRTGSRGSSTVDRERQGRRRAFHVSVR